MARLILFDIDGTLVHTGGVGRQAFAQTLAAEFDAKDGVDRVSFAGRTDMSLVRELFGIYHIATTRENFKRFFESYVVWLEHLMNKNGGNPCQGVKEFIQELQALPNPPLLGLLTGNIYLGAQIKLRHHGLWDTFKTGAFADDHEDRNHIAVAAFERARRALDPNLKPEEIIVVGDTPFDIQCGKFIGAKVLAVATGGATLEELKPHSPDWLVENLTKITAREVCGVPSVPVTGSTATMPARRPFAG